MFLLGAKDCEAGKHLACLHSKDEEAIGVVHLDTCPAESSTELGAPGRESLVSVCFCCGEIGQRLARSGGRGTRWYKYAKIETPKAHFSTEEIEVKSFQDILLEEFEQVPEEDLVIRPPSETRR